MNQKLIQHIKSRHKNEYEHVPNKKHLFNWLEHLLVLLFPLKSKSEEKLNIELIDNQEGFKNIFTKIGRDKNEIDKLTNRFYSHLNTLLEQLYLDAEEIYKHDPAANCLSEIIHTYPGFYAIAIYRIAHCLSVDLNIPYIPRMLTEHAHSRTGIDIHPNAQIASPFFIDHGTGIVIGETCKIGKYVNIYQGVTLGALQVSKDLKGSKRHPTVEDHVVIYANATILGGNTIIGNHSIIGGNVFLTKSINPYSTVFTRNETVVKPRKSDNEPINFII